MYIRVSLDQAPPTVELYEHDDFTSFRVVVDTPSHTWVEPEYLVGLAGNPDDEWKERVSGMVAYASSKGWVDEVGRIRAHVELAGADSDASGKQS